jgi:alkanesulfonate monooxygenase SsuD/methylene tetrahydromethanopterin reductase-like flavin-dependent oxidoreductase (luciferase family)
MDFGVCVATKIDDIDYIVRAEELGYDHAWLADSQMIWSDCYAALALAAVRTSRIRLGTGVAIAGTRTAPVTAHSIASINQLAPGRTFLGIGAGNTAMRLMGQKPLRIAEYGEYLRVVRGLLDGGETDFAWRGRSAPTRLMMAEQGFVALEPRIPMYVSGFGPKSQALAGELGDGLVMSIPPDPEFMRRALANVARGAERAGRELDPASFYTCSLTMAVLLDEGEDLSSPRVIEECGPFVISSLHYLYEQVHQLGKEPPPHVRDLWPDYCALVERTPERRRHLRVHEGHCTWMVPEEERFVTPELIRGTCLVGTAAEVQQQVRALAEAGLSQLMILPSFASRFEVLERFANEVVRPLREQSCTEEEGKLS